MICTIDIPWAEKAAKFTEEITCCELVPQLSNYYGWITRING